ncbi:hypothetical protein K502DRAFT_175444 [Neoconidiobolus thromboides FSU 785]|nr:hypothetical protein K502DRAFT_175444 [Neoconidiobolus thromboides FSU 785]
MDSIMYNQERKGTDANNNIKLNGITNTDEVINEVYEIIELYNSIKKKTNSQINELKIKEQGNLIYNLIITVLNEVLKIDVAKKVENDLRLYSKYVTKVNEINDESLRIKYNREIFKLSNKIQINEQLLLNVTEEVDTLENEIIEIENNLLTNYIPSDPNV